MGLWQIGMQAILSYAKKIGLDFKKLSNRFSLHVVFFLFYIIEIKISICFLHKHFTANAKKIDKVDSVFNDMPHLFLLLTCKVSLQNLIYQLLFNSKYLANWSIYFQAKMPICLIHIYFIFL